MRGPSSGFPGASGHPTGREVPVRPGAWGANPDLGNLCLGEGERGKVLPGRELLGLRQGTVQLRDDGSPGARAIRPGKAIQGSGDRPRARQGAAWSPLVEHSKAGHQAAAGPALWRLSHGACLPSKETGVKGYSEKEKGSPGLGVGRGWNLGLGDPFCLCTADSAPVVLCTLRCGEKEHFGSWRFPWGPGGHCSIAPCGSQD